MNTIFENQFCKVSQIDKQFLLQSKLGRYPDKEYAEINALEQAIQLPLTQIMLRANLIIAHLQGEHKKDAANFEFIAANYLSTFRFAAHIEIIFQQVIRALSGQILQPNKCRPFQVTTIAKNSFQQISLF